MFYPIFSNLGCGRGQPAIGLLGLRFSSWDERSMPLSANSNTCCADAPPSLADPCSALRFTGAHITAPLLTFGCVMCQGPLCPAWRSSHGMHSAPEPQIPIHRQRFRMRQMWHCQSHQSHGSNPIICPPLLALLASPSPSPSPAGRRCRSPPITWGPAVVLPLLPAQLKQLNSQKSLFICLATVKKKKKKSCDWLQ